MNGQEWAKYLNEGSVGAETELFRGYSLSGRPLGDENFLRRIGAA
jgi:hypothetical protein